MFWKINFIVDTNLNVKKHWAMHFFLFNKFIVWFFFESSIWGHVEKLSSFLVLEKHWEWGKKADGPQRKAEAIAWLYSGKDDVRSLSGREGTSGQLAWWGVVAVGRAADTLHTTSKTRGTHRGALAQRVIAARCAQINFTLWSCESWRKKGVTSMFLSGRKP